MNVLNILDPAISKTLSLTIAHFFWQGTVLAVLAGVVLACLRARHAQSRYVVCLLSLLLMLACLPATFAVVWQQQMQHARAEISQQPVGQLQRGVDPLTELEKGYLRSIPASNGTVSGKRDHGSTGADAPQTMEADAARSLTTVPDGVATKPQPTLAVRDLSWQNAGLLVCGTYLAGLLIMTARLVIAFYGGWRLCSRAVLVDDPRLLREVARVAAQVGLRREPAVAFCRRVAAPAVVGFVRPVILLPVTLATGLTPDQLRLVVAHELVHLRRHDHLVLLLQRLIETVLFFHPAVWWVSRWLRAERERCCDDAVLAAGNAKWDYAEMLLRVAELRFVGFASAPKMAALEAVGDPSELRRRIARLVAEPIEPTMRLTRWGALLVVLFVGAIMLSPAILSIRAGQPDTEETRLDERGTPAAVSTPTDGDEKDDKDAPRNRPRLNVTVSEKTTFVTDHITENGYADYRAAINARYGNGVTPENNAVVALLRADPTPEGLPLPDALYEKLGIKPVVEKGSRFQDLHEYIQQVAKGSNPPLDWKELYAKEEAKWRRAMKAPWQAKDAPMIADWLHSNEKPLATVTRGALRSRYYYPWIGGEGDLLITQTLPVVQGPRALARALSTRAMLRTGSGDLERAWNDVLTIHRLGRLVSQGPTLVEGLVGMAIDGIAAHASWALAQHDKLTAAQARRMQKQLAELPPIEMVAESVNYAERLVFLDVVQQLAKKHAGKADSADAVKRLAGELGGREWIDTNAASIDKIVSLSKFRWDDVMRRGNGWFDQLAAAAGKSDHEEREAAAKKIFAELQETAEIAARLPEIAETFPMGIKEPDKWAAHHLAGGLAHLLMPALQACTSAETRSRSYTKATQLALALAAYRSDTGSYPVNIAALSPKYIARIPTDPLGDPVIYEPAGDGYSLTIKDPAELYNIIVSTPND